MYCKIDMLDSQVNFWPDGPVEILGQSGHIRLEAEYSKKVKAAYQELLKAYPTKDSLKISINIEIPQPVGTIVNEGRFQRRSEGLQELRSLFPSSAKRGVMVRRNRSLEAR
jgi:hypothetical protein